MIETFSIKNFKNIRSLGIGGLKRINLFTGKNNTDKSTLLEAVALYVSEGDIGMIAQLLMERGEIIKPIGPNYKTLSKKSDIDTLASLFTDRKVGYDFGRNSIVLSRLQKSLFDEFDNTEEEVRISFVRYIDEKISTKEGEINKRRYLTDEIEVLQLEGDYNLGLQIHANGKTDLIKIGGQQLYRRLSRRYVNEKSNGAAFQFIRPKTDDIENSGYLWDQITLTEKEKYVIDALQIIEPKIQRIAFIGETSRDRTAVVKIEGSEKVVPLKGMGDGINRILTIILAALNSDNGYLLIDEFENGLHFSVQEQLWSILITLSKALNIQVFATTHSNDCIDGFENAMHRFGNSNLGRLFRLEKNESIGLDTVTFDIEEVKIATEENIEIR